MKSIRQIIEKIGDIADINEVLLLKDEALVILNKIESIVNDAEEVVRDINKSQYIELGETLSSLEQVSKSVY